MKLDLKTVGLPQAFMQRQPVELTLDERLSAYPSLFNPSPEAVGLWMTLEVKQAATAEIAWQWMFKSFLDACSFAKIPGIVLEADRHGANTQLRAFLSTYRRRVRNFIDKEFGELLSTSQVFRARSKNYIEQPDTLVIVSEVELRLPHGYSPYDALEKFRENRWVSWPAKNPMGRKGVFSAKYRRLGPGILTVGLSASIGQSLYLWYVIRCPYVPVPADSDAITINGITSQVNSMWKSIIKNYRWWSTNQPWMLKF